MADMTGAEKRAEGVTKAIAALVEEVENSNFRPMQKAAFLCSAKCCDTSSGQQLHNCCDRCQAPVQSAQKAFGTAMSSFQERLQRCAQRCQDKVQETLPSQPGERDIAKAQGQFANCLADCAQEYEKQVPKLKQDIQQMLKQFK